MLNLPAPPVAPPADGAQDTEDGPSFSNLEHLKAAHYVACLSTVCAEMGAVVEQQRINGPRIRALEYKLVRGDGPLRVPGLGEERISTSNLCSPIHSFAPPQLQFMPAHSAPAVPALPTPPAAVDAAPHPRKTLGPAVIRKSAAAAGLAFGPAAPAVPHIFAPASPVRKATACM